MFRHKRVVEQADRIRTRAWTRICCIICFSRSVLLVFTQTFSRHRRDALSFKAEQAAQAAAAYSPSRREPPVADTTINHWRVWKMTGTCNEFNFFSFYHWQVKPRFTYRICTGMIYRRKMCQAKNMKNNDKVNWRVDSACPHVKRRKALKWMRFETTLGLLPERRREEGEREGGREHRVTNW